MTINIYRNCGQWCYAAFIGGEYDHSDTLDVESEDDARSTVAEMFPEAEVRRVADTQEK